MCERVNIIEFISEMCLRQGLTDPEAWLECVSFFFLLIFFQKLCWGHARPSHTCMLSTDPGFCCDRPDHRVFSVGGTCIAVSSPWIRLLTGASPSPSTLTINSVAIMKGMFGNWTRTMRLFGAESVWSVKISVSFGSCDLLFSY